MNPLKRAAFAVASAVLMAGAAGIGAGTAFAGQPGASCEDNPTTPGNSASAPGSAFNPNGKAGTVYAGEQDQNDNNVHSVSQYDVACIHQPGH